MFLPSEPLALRFLRCQQEAPADLLSSRVLRRVLRSEGFSDEEIDKETATPALHRLDANARHGPGPGSPVNVWQVRHTIAEQLDRLLGTLARWQSAVKPHEPVTVVAANRRFEPPVATELAQRLGLRETDNECGRALRKLAVEFYQWVQDREEERKELGLDLSPDGRLVLTCAPLRRQLDPLPPLRGQRIRPVPPGTSIGSPQANSAAICCLVVTALGKLSFLTTNRIFPQPSDSGNNVIGTPLLQPGVEEGGIPEKDTIGFVEESLPVSFTQTNIVAGALATTSRDKVSPLFPRVGEVQCFTTTSVGEAVQILSTGWQLLPGKVVHQNAGTRVQFPGGEADFQHLMEVEFSATTGDGLNTHIPHLLVRVGPDKLAALRHPWQSGEVPGSAKEGHHGRRDSLRHPNRGCAAGDQ